MPNDEQQSYFDVIFPHNGVIQMTSGQIKGLVQDADSWVNFLFLLLGKRTFAAMRIYEPGKKEPEIIKVIRGGQDQVPPYASLV